MPDSYLERHGGSAVVEASQSLEHLDKALVVVTCGPLAVAVAQDGMVLAAVASVRGVVGTPSARWADEHLEAWGVEVVLEVGPWGDRLGGAGRTPVT